MENTDRAIFFLYTRIFEKMIRKETIRYLEFKSHPARRELFASFLPGVFCPITGYRAQEGLWRGYRQDVERGGGGGGDVKKYFI